MGETGLGSRGEAGVCPSADEHPTTTISATKLNDLKIMLILQTFVNYQSPFGASWFDAIVGVSTRRDPKLTVGTEIVRDEPRPSSSDTLNDGCETSMGNVWSMLTTGAGVLAGSHTPAGRLVAAIT